ncbi:Fmp25p KNAG_0L00150 [Huiozyma naganishii CBS 8797]|uniref:RCC1-like domain-containing protein n=1 Tax=Huiozyma naganishii (strain ATCC MYA-139 / BCRC 22969 / CBS 8797 / KCTC 17520 / NBRC 10181 / NCYC 3082 / Yp74L-3) TaxID=1071383 RepID=J7RRX9_HUIN7|nr:hypothetical protein KNAG_0L00150 [Kazachstania naganishii CBS 8797]CCK72638.1 hypothetical protein KNAG_0L00150 [Kazachstania naganishii CBS 8797]
MWRRSLVRHFSRSSRLQVAPKFDDAELLAKNLNRLEYNPTRRTRPVEDEPTDTNQQEIHRSVQVQRIGSLRKWSLWALLLGVAAGGAYYGGYFRSDGTQGQEPPSTRRTRKRRTVPAGFKTQLDPSVPGLYYIGDTNDGYTGVPTRISPLDHRTLRDVCIVSGERGNAIIDKRGNLYRWEHKRTGDTVEPVLRDQQLVKVRHSGEYLYALNERGHVLVVPWGNKESPRQYTSRTRHWYWPLSHYDTYNWRLPIKDKVVDLAAGGSHLILLTDAARAYTCSTGPTDESQGQFGLLNEIPPVNLPQPIELLNQFIDGGGVVQQRRIKQIACGNVHTVALDDQGRVLTFGANTYGQVGVPFTYSNLHVVYPRELPATKLKPFTGEETAVKAIAAGKETSYLVLSNGSLVSFGNGAIGQLGNGSMKGNQSAPTLVKLPNDPQNRVQRVIAGSNADHAFAVMTDGTVLAWGANDAGQLGNWKHYKVSRPTVLPSLTYDAAVPLTIDPATQSLSIGPQSSCIYSINRK